MMRFTIAGTPADTPLTCSAFQDEGVEEQDGDKAEQEHEEEDDGYGAVNPAGADQVIG